MKGFLLLIFLLVVWGCERSEKEECVVKPDVSNIDLTFHFENLGDSLLNISSKKELIVLLSRNPALRDYILRRGSYPDDSVFINTLYRTYTHPSIDSLKMETKRVFGDLSGLRAQFEEAFTNIKSYYPDFIPPKVQTVISGIQTDLLVSDSLIIVSIDFYFGKNAKYRPEFYEYQLRRYDPEDIVPSCLLLYGIDERLNKTDLEDKTVLAEMIAYGKAFYFAKHMLPCVPDSVFLWYTSDEIAGARENEDLIWARFIQDKVLYSTSMMDKRNYLKERPFTTQVGEKCPGRIGQWVGWRIVKQYMQNEKNKTLPELMNNPEAQEIFRASRYRPKKT